MKIFPFVSTLAILAATAYPTIAQDRENQTLVVTASNATVNQLLVYDSSGNLVQTVATGGQGGVSGNSGGIAASHNRVAVVNFGSHSVSIFERSENVFRLNQTISTSSGPVSVAFGHHHLYVLGTTTVESHRLYKDIVDSSLDGVASLIVGDGSAAQVGVIEKQLIISEKSNVIESVNLTSSGAIIGAPSAVQNLPANVNAPFGMVTRGNDAYVTIAHADEISLVRNDSVVTTTSSGTQHAPCWLALDGSYLFSTNTSSHSVSRYLVYGKRIVQDAAIAATFNGNPTDIDFGSGLVSAIDSNATTSHLSIFRVDGNGSLSLKASTSLPSANGVAIVSGDEE